MEAFLSVLPNLSIGVIAVLVLGYITIRHDIAMSQQRADFLAALDKKDQAFRELEASVRANLTEQLTKNTVALLDVAKVLAKAIRVLGDD